MRLLFASFITAAIQICSAEKPGFELQGLANRTASNTAGDEGQQLGNQFRAPDNLSNLQREGSDLKKNAAADPAGILFSKAVIIPPKYPTCDV